MILPLLVLFEGCAIFAAACGVLVIFGRSAGAGLFGVTTLAAAAALSVICLAAFFLAELYDRRVLWDFEALLRRLPRALAATALVAGLFFLVAFRAWTIREVLASTLLLTIAAVFGPFLPLRAALRLVCRRFLVEHLLIVGTSPLGRAVAAEIAKRPDLRCTVVDPARNGADLRHVIGSARPDRIVVALADRRGRLPLSRLVESLAHGIPVEDVAETFERLSGKLALETLSPSSLIFSREFQRSRGSRTLTRIFGVVAASVALVLLSPLIGLIALLIKLDSRGPVFFVQERVGLSGRPFKLLKFRTMHPIDRRVSEWEADNRGRITRVGRWLRRFRDGHSVLDELPQLINVVRGDMNLVGPRPHAATDLTMLTLAARNVSEVSADAIPYYELRCSIRPGMTGWAQIRYPYANTLDEELEKLRYDLYYVKYRSFRFDLAILFETLKMMLAGGGETAPAEPRTASRDAVPSGVTALGQPAPFLLSGAAGPAGDGG